MRIGTLKRRFVSLRPFLDLSHKFEAISSIHITAFPTSPTLSHSSAHLPRPPPQLRPPLEQPLHLLAPAPLCRRMRRRPGHEPRQILMHPLRQLRLLGVPRTRALTGRRRAVAPQHRRERALPPLAPQVRGRERAAEGPADGGLARRRRRRVPKVLGQVQQLRVREDVRTGPRKRVRGRGPLGRDRAGGALGVLGAPALAADAARRRGRLRLRGVASAQRALPARAPVRRRLQLRAVPPPALLRQAPVRTPAPAAARWGRVRVQWWRRRGWRLSLGRAGPRPLGSQVAERRGDKALPERVPRVGVRGARAAGRALRRRRAHRRGRGRPWGRQVRRERVGLARRRVQAEGAVAALAQLGQGGVDALPRLTLVRRLVRSVGRGGLVVVWGRRVLIRRVWVGWACVWSAFKM